ncbi:unnamed protein product [Phytophthora fragariaefolia]|uniref:Unnamed protein product n=1 Tax=Phytophthora fragariaefolia TaxID=1490495 RepID=A0A9W6XXL2_9STRA|nr:unnamed protein product [Phytophthora fragariaefolia]
MPSLMTRIQIPNRESTRVRPGGRRTIWLVEQSHSHWEQTSDGDGTWGNIQPFAGEEAVLRHFVEHVDAADGDGGVVIGSGRGRGARPAGVQVPAAVVAAAAADGDDGVVVGSGRVRGGGDDAGNGGAVIASPTISTSSAISTTPCNLTSLTSSIENLLLKKMVAFSPPKESWMQKNKIYRCVVTAYIVDRVCRRVKKPKNGMILQIMWLDTMFQNAVEVVTIATVQRSIDNYQTLMPLPDKPAWRDLTDAMVGGELNLDLPLDELEIASDEEGYERYDPERSLPASLAEVEAVKSMRFEPELEMEAPSDLYAHTDDSTTTRLVPEYSSLFAPSASSNFFAYLPVYFWKQVVLESNRCAVAKEIRITTPFSMEELMTFLGIMFYMTLTDKGEYSNYWGSQTEDAIFGGASTSLDTVMSLRRFKLIRRCLSFRSEPGMSVERDSAARIRP